MSSTGTISGTAIDKEWWLESLLCSFLWLASAPVSTATLERLPWVYISSFFQPHQAICSTQLMYMYKANDLATPESEQCVAPTGFCLSTRIDLSAGMKRSLIKYKVEEDNLLSVALRSAYFSDCDWDESCSDEGCYEAHRGLQVILTLFMHSCDSREWQISL